MVPGVYRRLGRISLVEMLVKTVIDCGIRYGTVWDVLPPLENFMQASTPKFEGGGVNPPFKIKLYNTNDGSCTADMMALDDNAAREFLHGFGTAGESCIDVIRDLSRRLAKCFSSRVG